MPAFEMIHRHGYLARRRPAASLRQAEGERRALARFRLGPDAAAMALDDAVDDREADAGALELLGAVQPLKGAEELGGVAHVEPRAVVAHGIDPLPRLK